MALERKLRRPFRNSLAENTMRRTSPPSPAMYTARNLIRNATADGIVTLPAPSGRNSSE